MRPAGIEIEVVASRHPGVLSAARTSNTLKVKHRMQLGSSHAMHTNPQGQQFTLAGIPTWPRITERQRSKDYRMAMVFTRPCCQRHIANAILSMPYVLGFYNAMLPTPCCQCHVGDKHDAHTRLLPHCALICFALLDVLSLKCDTHRRVTHTHRRAHFSPRHLSPDLLRLAGGAVVNEG